MPTEKNMESFRLGAGETDLPELESGQLESLEFEFQELELPGYNPQGLESVGLEPVDIESLEIKSVYIEAMEIESVVIESADIDPLQVDETSITERRNGVLADFDPNELKIVDHATQGVPLGGGYDPYNQTRSMSHPAGKTGGGTRR